MNTKDIGTSGEHLAVYKLLAKGLTISRPLGDNSPYDLILDINGQLLTCQVKTRRSTDVDKVQFNLRGIEYGTLKNKRYSVDCFCCVDLSTEEVFLIPNVDINVSITIRYTQPLTSNGRDITYAKDVTIDKFLEVYGS